MARLISLCLLFFAVASPGHAMWMRAETEPVPVDRLLTNLTKRAAIETNNFELLHAIARLHSLSYARGASNWVVPVATNIPGGDRLHGVRDLYGLPWFGHDLPLPPPLVTAAIPNAQPAATKHLSNAIDFYQRAIQIRPTNEFVQIGLGWCRIQAGQTNEARAPLRRAIELGKLNSKWSWNSLHATTATEEAIGYLLTILHPVYDFLEVGKLTELKAEVEKTRKSHNAYTPLIVPLQPSVRLSQLIDSNAAVPFDLDGSHVPNAKWQWITTNAAWIVHLPQGGRVTSALQMFGNVTFWMFWENGYHALASLDDNADGLLSGDELRGVQLWQDRNSDGQCTPDELLQLSQLGITALDTRYTIENQIPTSPTGAHFNDNTTRPTYDLVLRRR